MIKSAQSNQISRSAMLVSMALASVALVALMALTGRDSVAQSGSSSAVATVRDGSAAWVATSGGVQFCRVRAPLTDRPDVTCFSAKVQ